MVSVALYCLLRIVFQQQYYFFFVFFWATVCKTVRRILSDRCLSACLSCPVCNVGVLWPNGWMDQDETWHAGRPRPWPHCVRWGLRSPFPTGTATPPPIFGPYLLCWLWWFCEMEWCCCHRLMSTSIWKLQDRMAQLCISRSKRTHHSGSWCLHIVKGLYVWNIC